MQHQELKNAIAEFYERLAPYAHVVIAPNYPANAFGNPRTAFAAVERLTKGVAIRLDHRYFGTRRLLRDIAPSDRFDAMCWPEKLASNPHVHCAFFLPPLAAERLNDADREAEKARRLVYLLASLHSSGAKLLDADRDLLNAHPSAVRDGKLVTSLKRFCPSATYSVSGVFDAAGLAQYTGKEYNDRREEGGSGFFFLGKFHSELFAR
jgi:hypothetical protein